MARIKKIESCLAAYTAFKLTMPESLREECFRWLDTHYSIMGALYLISRDALLAEEIDVVKWATPYGLSREPEDPNATSFTISLFNGVMDKDALKDTIDPEKYPIILANHTWGRGKKRENTTLIIDGNHRLRKAFLKGMKTIRAYYLPEEYSKLIRNNYNL
jgi:hypothetical protein